MNELSFSGTGRDRAHALRSDPAALAALLAEGLILPLMRGLILADDSSLGWLPQGHPLLEGASEPVFLGLWQGKGVFAVRIPDFTPEEGIPDAGVFDAGLQPHPRAPQGRQFTELRRIMSALCPDEAELAATARALTEWHNGHAFCARCGRETQSGGAGWHRKCASCKAMHFPRTDPVVIMLVTRGNHLLLGRSPGWPEGMYSTLAGFIEPGETMEAAVRREVHEETGVLCGPVRYIASQPWPFPASLMLGCHAEAESEAITLDPAELEDALWLSREELVDVLAGTHPVVRPPRQGAIARFLLSGWLAGRL
ncbi:NAD(+) diphosphatase [Pseudogemmobacter sp. CC-YST710]|uniref:NAD(+) diphosphatase n=2 Tax=Pseudogemmobacter faecipullorum TaxID=2755041 RepID=A0ABS8CJG7_9RHOB|nr:NAD(+) diphosphatase [Pseudogemmobacter faecipullorum]